MNTDKKLRQQLVKHLEGGMAFLPPEDFIYDIPYEKTGIRTAGLPYSIWEVMYHLRYAQADIIEFSIHSGYKNKKWPDEYWPENPAPDSPKTWQETIDGYFMERDQLKKIILDTEWDLFAPLPHATDMTLLREIILVIEHNAYHVGQLVVLARLLGFINTNN